MTSEMAEARHPSPLVPRPLSLIDTHAHLDAAEFEDDRDAVLQRARQAGVAAIVCPAIDANSSEAVVRLADAGIVSKKTGLSFSEENRPSELGSDQGGSDQGGSGQGTVPFFLRRSPSLDLFAAVGIQPNYCAQAKPDDWGRVVALAGEPRVVAIGETGLDRHWDFTPFGVQQDYFDRHLRLAQDRDLPVIIHCREAETDVLAMLREAAARGSLRGVLHAFSGDRSFAEACLALGLYISFAGAVTYTNKKFAPLREAAAMIPDDRLLIETDSPYLVPHPLRGKEKRNEPAHVVLTASVLADLRRQSVEHIAVQTTSNASRLFRTA